MFCSLVLVRPQKGGRKESNKVFWSEIFIQILKLGTTGICWSMSQVQHSEQDGWHWWSSTLTPKPKPVPTNRLKTLSEIGFRMVMDQKGLWSKPQVLTTKGANRNQSYKNVTWLWISFITELAFIFSLLTGYWKANNNFLCLKKPQFIQFLCTFLSFIKKHGRMMRPFALCY